MRILCIMVMLCGMSGAFGAAWPTYHGGSDLRGVAEVTLPDRLEKAWLYNTSGRIDNTPVSDGERIFMSPGKGRIMALALTGSPLWEMTFTRKNNTGDEVPLVFDAPFLSFKGLLIAGSSRGILLALDAETGEEKWRLDIDGIMLGSPNILDDKHIVVLDQGTGSLHGIELETGKVKWTTEEVERCDGSPGVGGGHVVFGSCLAALHIYNAEDGKHLRDIEIGGEGQIAGGVAMDGNLAFCGARDGRLICADVSEGKVVWTSSESIDQTFSTPAVGQDRVVYTSDDGFVYAVDRKSGSTQWKFDTGGLPYSPVLAGDKVLVAVDGELIMLKAADGTLLWKQSVSDDITSPAIINGYAVVGADDGTISAWGAKLPVEKQEE